MTDQLFKHLYETWRDRLVTVARLYVRDQAAAEDIVADSFVRLWRAAPTLPSDVKIEAYLVTIVKNQCLNYLKSVQTHQRVDDEMGAHRQRLATESIRSLSALEPGQLFASEVQRLVSESLGKMPGLTRQVFSESRYAGKSYEDIAEELGIPPRRVHTEMQKALSALRDALKDYLPAWLLALYLEQLLK